jgi:hypothetical protein
MCQSVLSAKLPGLAFVRKCENEVLEAVWVLEVAWAVEVVGAVETV